jgi:hypothetical protein
MTIQALRLLVGAALLFLGRRLYWLFVAGVGFVVAADLVPQLLQIETTILILIIAAIVGVIGAFLAVFLQRAAIAVAGFLAGGYVVLALLDTVGLEIALIGWIVALVGAILGAVLTVLLFDWALIVLSSLAGAGLIIRGLPLENTTIIALVFVILLALGVAVQAALLSRTEEVIED